MSIQAKILNFMLKKYVKDLQPPVEERSYVEARKMMNQDGYVDKSASLGSRLLQKFVFNKSNSKISTNEIFFSSMVLGQHTAHSTRQHHHHAKTLDQLPF